MWLNHTGKTPKELPKGALGRGGKFYVCLVERKGSWCLLCLRDAVTEILGYQHQELHHKLSKVQPTISGFGWELRGGSVAAGVGIPNHFWEHSEVTICGTIGDTVNWGPTMHFFILFFP